MAHSWHTQHVRPGERRWANAGTRATLDPALRALTVPSCELQPACSGPAGGRSDPKEGRARLPLPRGQRGPARGEGSCGDIVSLLLPASALRLLRCHAFCCVCYAWWSVWPPLHIHGREAGEGPRRPPRARGGPRLALGGALPGQGTPPGCLLPSLALPFLSAQPPGRCGGRAVPVGCVYPTATPRPPPPAGVTLWAPCASRLCGMCWDPHTMAKLPKWNWKKAVVYAGPSSPPPCTERQALGVPQWTTQEPR